MSLSRFALLSQKSQFTYRKFSIVWLPLVKCLLLLCIKSEASMNKEKHSLRNFAALQSGGATRKKFLPTSNVTFDTKGANFENDIASEKWL